VLSYWLIGFSMMLVIEGLIPFLFPDMWRETFVRLVSLNNGQLRFIGIVAMLCGLLMLYWI
jgi:uncharacterized protein YjeT (DUF2065 family)